MVPKLQSFLADKETDGKGRYRTVDLQSAFAEQRFELSDGLFQVHSHSSGWVDFAKFIEAITLAVNDQVAADVTTLVSSLASCDEGRAAFMKQMGRLNFDVLRNRDRKKDDVVWAMKSRSPTRP